MSSTNRCWPKAAIRQVVTETGFTRFRRAAQTPFNLAYEVRPSIMTANPVLH
jgi:hypothetical protein